MNDNVDGFFVDFDEETGELETIDVSISGEVISEKDFSDNYILNTEMSKEEAIDITNSIKSTGVALYVLIQRAHAGKAYKALGYSSFGDYVTQEFEISTSRAYQLLNLAETIRVIEEVTPANTEIRLTEAQARDIKRELPNITEKIEQETEGKTPEESKEIVENIISEERESINNPTIGNVNDYPTDDENSDFDLIEDKPQGNNNSSNHDNNVDDFDSVNSNVNNIDNALTERDDSDDNETYTNKSQFRPKKVEYKDIESFMGFMDTVTRLPKVHDFLGSLSSSQRKEISMKALEASDYLNELLDELAIQEMSR